MRGLVPRLLLVGLLASAPSARGQSVLQFEHLDVRDGLSQSTIRSLVQDREGFVWIGTQGGLNRYDGYEFSVYRHDPSVVESLGDPLVQVLIEDSDGFLWIGTRNGLNRFDKTTRRFTRFPTPKPDAEQPDVVTALFEDSQGVLWVGTRSSGLHPFDRDAERYTESPWPIPSELQAAWVNVVFEDSRGHLWVGTSGDGAYRLDRAAGRFIAYRYREDEPDSLSSDNVSSIAESEDGTVWIGTSNGGLNAHHPDHPSTFVHYRHDESRPESLGSDQVRRVLEDSRGRLWIGTIRGLDAFDRERQRFEHYRHAPNNPSSLSQNEVTAIMEDAQGMLWVGTRVGLNRWDPSTLAFGHIGQSDGASRGLSGNVVSSLFVDSRDRLWVGTYGQGLNQQSMEDPLAFHVIGHHRSDPESLADVHHLPEDDWPHIYGENGIYSAFEDDRGTLWFGTGAGLHERVPGDVHGAPARFIRYQYDRNVPDSLSHNEVLAIAQDGSGDLWIGTYGGLNRLVEGEEVTFERYRHQASDPRSLASDFARMLYRDSRGILWVGTHAGLDEVVPGEPATFLHHEPSGEDPYSLSHPVVTAINEDREGNLWVGTLGGGLNKLDRQTGRFSTYMEREGLSNNVVRGILVDAKDRLWITTSKGIDKFDPETTTFTLYGSEDGILVEEFSVNSSAKDGRGKLYFGGLNGVTVIDPDEITQNPYRPPVVFTDLLLSNETVPVEPAEEDGLLTRDINFAERVELAYSDSQFAVEFSALNYRQSSKNRFAYRLEGFEDSWTYTDAANRRAVYTNISPGTYTLRVKAANDDGVWNEEGRALVITIVPPWWQSLPFRSSLLLLVLSIGYAGYRFRVGAIERRSRELEAKVAERTESLEQREKELVEAKEAAESANRAKSTFLSTMSHELRTPLSAILGFAQLIARDDALAGEQRENARIIGRSGEHLLNLIDDVLEVSKIEAGRTTLELTTIDLFATVQTVAEMMRLRAAEKGLELVVERAPDTPKHIRCDEHKLRQVLINLLGNAVKYTSRGRVELRVSAAAIEGEPAVRFEVVDSGVGIQTDRIAEVFEPFVRREDETTPGTGLGLTISREYVRLMGGGDIQVVSRPGEGSIFGFTLPCEPDHAEAADEGEPVQPVRRVAALAPGQPEPRALIADDDASGRTLLRKMLEPFGFVVEEVENGREAVAHARSWHPDVIFMDLRMPATDGLAATRAIRESESGESGSRRTIIVGVTAEALAEKRDGAFRAGCDDFITKPFREAEIVELLARRVGVLSEEVVVEAPEETRESLGALALGLRHLSSSLLLELEQAAAALEPQTLERVIGVVRSQDAATAAGLTELAQRFDYKRIMTLARDAREAKDAVDA